MKKETGDSDHGGGEGHEEHSNEIGENNVKGEDVEGYVFLDNVGEEKLDKGQDKIFGEEVE